MEQEYKIAALIQRYVSGNATEEERNEVERWMAESEEHGVLMEKFRSDVFLQEQLAEHDIFDVEDAFKRFRKSKRWPGWLLFFLWCWEWLFIVG